MSTTVSVPITIRNEIKECKLPAYSGETYYHGSYVALDGTGYLRNFTTSLTGIKMIGILKSDYFVDGAFGSTQNPQGTPGVMTASAAGNLSANTNCLEVYTYGEFLATFESTVGLSVTDEGMPVYIVDNSTLTVSPKLGYKMIGKLTKYINSTTGHVAFDSWSETGTELITIHQPLPAGATSGTLNLVANVLNPFGATVFVKDFDLALLTTCSTALGTVGICPTSSGAIATYIYSTSTIDFGTVGMYTINKSMTYTTSGALPLSGGEGRTWKATEYLVIQESATTTTEMTGWWTARVYRA